MKQSKRARDLAKRPDVAAWVAELNRVMQSAPPGLWLFADSAGLSVMALDADGQRAVNRHGGMDQREMVVSVDFGERRLMIDGGDW